MDNIANMLVQIKNAQAIGKKTAVIPFSKTKFAIAKILEKTNFIAAVGTEDRKEKKVLVVDLKYQNQKPAIFINHKNFHRYEIPIFACLFYYVIHKLNISPVGNCFFYFFYFML